MTHPTIARAAIALIGAGLLSACASQPRVTSQVESREYRAHAGRNYTAPGPASDPWGPYIVEAAAQYDVPQQWIRAVMHQESGGHLYSRSGDLITSGAGAMGLMQVMPATYDELRARYSELGDDAFDPRNNIMAGTAYIREMYDIYGAPGFLAAYNAGPGRLDDYLTRNRTLPEETRRYVANIGPHLAGVEPSRPSPGAQYAMNAMPFSIPSGSRYTASSRYSAPAPVITLNPPTMAPAEPIQLAAAPRPAPMAAPAPIQVAAAEPAAGPYIVLRPQPVEVAELPQPSQQPSQQPSLQSFSQPLPQRAFASQAPIYLAPPAQLAQLPEPPRPVAPPAPSYAFREPPRSQQQLASAALVPVAPRGSTFSLFSQANAEPIGIHRGGYASGAWAVQVGAFANEGLASSATFTARDHARDVLGSAHPSVTAVRQPHGLLYRARLTGLSRDAAAQACERLAHARTTCIVVSPDAQS